MTNRRVGDQRLFAAFLAFKVVAGLWIFQNAISGAFAYFPLVGWLMALVLAYAGWLKRHPHWVRAAYWLEWLTLLSLWGFILWGLASQWRWASRHLTTYEVDLLLRSGAFYLVSVLGSYRLQCLAQEWPSSSAEPSWRQARRQQFLAYLQLGMLLFFLVPLLNQVRFAFQMVNLGHAIWLNSLLLVGTGLAYGARATQSVRGYWMLTGVNTLLAVTPALYGFLLRVELTPFFWRSLVLYLPFIYLAVASGRLARTIVSGAETST